MNKFMNGMNEVTNVGYTENGAVKHLTTNSALLDLFGMGAAYRNRSDEDCILLFKNALEENEVYALKCLFYIRDVRGGQGERRFWRVCMKWLAQNRPEVAKRNLELTAMFGRWDDLYTFIGTPVQNAALGLLKAQIKLDMECKTPSLCAKWLKSENTTSMESRRLAKITRQYFGMSAKEYRKMLSTLRARINVLERLMSAGKWDEIEFDKIPSKAGMKYKNAFARHDLERVKAGVESYKDFANDNTTKVNAEALYPYECVHEALGLMGNQQGYGRYNRNNITMNDTQRLMINKYWANLKDYFNGASFNGIALVDTSGSMNGTPIEVAISLGLYCAEKNTGAFADHFISFESNPHWIKTEGVDFCDKVHRITGTGWGGSTNVEGAMDLILNVALTNHCRQDEIPQNLVIISDMEFNCCVTSNTYSRNANNTLFEKISAKFRAYGYEMPHLIFWNVDARSNNIPMRDNGYVSYVSGFSPSIFEMIMSGKNGYNLMMETLDSPRYSLIH